MKNKKTKKGFTIVELVILGVVLVAALTFIIIEMANPGASISVWIKDNVVDTEKIGKDFMTHLPTLIQSIIYIVVIYAVCKLIRMVFSYRMKKSDRAKTVLTLLDGLVKYACAIAIIIFVLQALGVNATAIFASVGILTLVIGLGCQSLIADIVAGMFIIFENEYNVGEIVTIDDFRGTVIEIGIRATKLLDYAGNIKIINNSDISNVVNMSRELSLAVVDCLFPYDVPVQHIEKILKDNFEAFRVKIPGIVEGPFYKGVSDFGASNIAVTIIAKCLEEDRYQVQRDLMREYYIAFHNAGIDISYDQIVVQQYEPTHLNVSDDLEKETTEFIKEQRDDSKGMETDNKE